jgi:DNA-binding transcriptional LysR family regulator
VAETGRMTQAAKVVHITQSAVTPAGLMSH